MCLIVFSRKIAKWRVECKEKKDMGCLLLFLVAYGEVFGDGFRVIRYRAVGRGLWVDFQVVCRERQGSYSIAMR